jgi:hypothetical protein
LAKPTIFEISESLEINLDLEEQDRNVMNNVENVGEDVFWDSYFIKYKKNVIEAKKVKKVEEEGTYVVNVDRLKTLKTGGFMEKFDSSFSNYSGNGEMGKSSIELFKDSSQKVMSLVNHILQFKNKVVDQVSDNLQDVSELVLFKKIYQLFGLQSNNSMSSEFFSDDLIGYNSYTSLKQMVPLLIESYKNLQKFENSGIIGKLKFQKSWIYRFLQFIITNYSLSSVEKKFISNLARLRYNTSGEVLVFAYAIILKYIFGGYYYGKVLLNYRNSGMRNLNFKNHVNKDSVKRYFEDIDDDLFGDIIDSGINFEKYISYFSDTLPNDLALGEKLNY